MQADIYILEGSSSRGFKMVLNSFNKDYKCTVILDASILKRQDLKNCLKLRFNPFLSFQIPAQMIKS